MTENVTTVPQPTETPTHSNQEKPDMESTKEFPPLTENTTEATPIANKEETQSVNTTTEKEPTVKVAATTEGKKKKKLPKPTKKIEEIKNGKKKKKLPKPTKKIEEIKNGLKKKNKLKPIEKQVVVIFGASSGIGRETALLLANEGAKVVIAARSKIGIDSLAEEITKNGGEVLPIIADCCDHNQLKDVINKTIEKWGRIDTWCQNAGVALFAKTEDTTVEEFQRLIDINTFGAFRAAQEVLPHLKKNGGSLIFITSIEGKRALPYNGAYAASKHALIALIDSLRVELQMEKCNVNVVNIMPAAIWTPFYDKCKVNEVEQNVPYTSTTFYRAIDVAESIAYCSEHYVRDLVVGTTGLALLKANSMFPKLVDWYFMKNGHKYVKGDKRKLTQENNLEGPIDGFDTIEGHWNANATPSLYNWLFVRQQPLKIWSAAAIAGIGTGILGGYLLKSFNRKRNPSRAYHHKKKMIPPMKTSKHQQEQFSRSRSTSRTILPSSIQSIMSLLPKIGGLSMLMNNLLLNNKKQHQNIHHTRQQQQPNVIHQKKRVHRKF